MKRNRALTLAFLAGSCFSFSAHAENIVGINAANDHLISFDSATPGSLTGDVAISGLGSGALVSLDYRPSSAGDPRVVAVVQGPTAADCRLFSITKAGVATAIGAATYACDTIGEIDFNPVVDRLRSIGAASNYRINPDTGAKIDGDTGTAGVQNDTAPSWAAAPLGCGATPSINGVAYDRNTDSGGVTPTTLFGLETGCAADRLVMIGSADGTPASPNGGVVTDIGPLGITLAGVPTFDISGSSGTAYLSASVGGTSQLYTVNTATGAAFLVGTIGTGINLLGMTAAPASFNVPNDSVKLDGSAMPQALLALFAGLALLRRRLTARSLG